MEKPLSHHSDREVALIFSAVATKAPAERMSFLERACRDRPQLRQAVDAMLAEHDKDLEEDRDEFSEDDSRVITTSDPTSIELSDTDIIEFGDYVLKDEIARGGMGVVYRAEHQRLKRTVALKMIRSTLLANDTEVQRFVAEAEAAAALDHPNIVPIYEIGEIDGQHYFTMRVVEGGTLRKRLKDLRHHPKDCARLMVIVAHAVHAAHQRGIIHRDLKPSNILIDDKGEPQVTDFGIAKQMSSDSGLTLSGQIMGTPHYMSPEQASGSSRDITTAADIYGLGAILYEMVTGRPPHRADSMMETLRRVVEEEPATPASIDALINRDLETIILKCLEKDPEARYPSAAGLANDLERWLREEPIIARPAGNLERFRKWVRRRPVHASLAGVAALLLLTLGVGGPLVAVQQSKLRLKADKATGLAERRAAETLRNLYFSEALFASSMRGERNDISRIRETVERWRPENAGVDLRGWEWYFLHGLNPVELEATHLDAKVVGVSATTDGKRLAVATEGGVLVVDKATGETIAQHSTPTKFARWSPDGSQLLTGGWRQPVGLLDPVSGRVTRQFTSYPQNMTMVAWSPTGTLLASGSFDRVIDIWDAGSGERLHRIEDVGAYPFFDWSQDGRRLYFPGASQLEVWEVGSEANRELTADWDHRMVQSLAVSPDGKILACGLNSGFIRFVEIASGEILATAPGHAATAAHALAWAPEGTHLASAGDDGVIFIWDRQTFDPVREIRHGGAISDLKWSQTDRLTVACDRRTFEMDVSDYKDPRILETAPGTAIFRNTLSFSSNGRLLAGTGNELLLRPEGGGALESVLQTSGVVIRRAVISPDGSRVAWAASKGPLSVAETSEGELSMTTKALPWIDVMRFSPDSRLIATAHHNRGGIQIRDAESGDLLHTLEPEYSRSMTGVTWSPDGRLVAAQSSAGEISVWQVDSGAWVASDAETQQGYGYGVKWEPRGKRFASIGAEGTIAIWELDGSKLLVRTLPNRDAGIADFDWSPDGSRIVSLSTDGILRLADSETGAITLRMRVGKSGPFERENIDVEWSPDGRSIAYSVSSVGAVHTLLAPEWRARKKTAER